MSVCMSNNSATAPVIDYELLEQEKSVEIQQDLTRRLSSNDSRGGSPRHAILGLVAAGSYQRAKDELGGYFEDKGSYPGFVARCERYAKHCTDLISAIESKRNFPGLAHLSLAKRQELFEKVEEHFNELKQYLKQIEMIEKETKIDDLRSTVIFLRALANSVFLVLSVAFLIELATSLGPSFMAVFEVMTNNLVDALFRLF